MKRLLIPFILLLILVFPVSASDFSEKQVINLLDYITVGIDNTTGDDIDLGTIPESLRSLPIYGIDILYEVVYGESPPSANYYSAEGDIFLEYDILGNNLFRMRGRSDVPLNLQDALIFFEAEEDFSIYLYQINVSLSPDLDADSDKYDGHLSSSLFGVVPYDGWLTEIEIDYDGEDYPGQIQQNSVTIFPSYWYLFDSYSINVSTSGLGFRSVQVDMSDGTPVPFEVSYYNYNDLEVTSTSIIINCDLSQIDHTLDSSLRITVEYNYFYSQYHWFQVSDAHGSVNKSPNFFSVWFQKIVDSLGNLVNGNRNQESASDRFEDKVEEQDELLGDLTTDLNAVERPDLGSIELSPVGMVDPGVVTLTTSGISSALGNEILLRVLLIALTFALAGFILYGKK